MGDDTNVDFLNMVYFDVHANEQVANRCTNTAQQLV